MALAQQAKDSVNRALAQQAKDFVGMVLTPHAKVLGLNPSHAKPQ